MAETLGQLLERRDEEGWVGRDRELAKLEALLSPDSRARIVFVHGQGGMGKSSLLRRLARRGEANGYSARLVDARDLDPVPGALERAIGPVSESPAPLLLLDTYERMTGLDGHLRRDVLPALPGGARVVIAGRRPPPAEWLQGGWEQIVSELALEGLSRTEALELVHGRGVDDDDSAAELVAWGGGSPLMLTLAADAARGARSWSAMRGGGDRALAEVLLRRLTQSELEAPFVPMVELAGLARSVTPRLVTSLLPDVDAPAAVDWLRSRSFAESTGAGVRLHEVVRTAVRAHLRATDPDRDRDLRRRMADNLFARAAGGETNLIIDLAELMENPALRWGMGAEGTVDFRVDTIRESDLEAAREAVLNRSDAAEWWDTTDQLLRAAPHLAVVVRDPEDRICGMAVATTPNGAPPAADVDPVLGPWLDYARRTIPEGDVIVWRDSLDLTASEKGDVSSRVLAIVNTATILRSGLANPRFSFLPIDPENPVAVAFSAGVGARHVPELDQSIGGKTQQCHVLYHGMAGVVGGTRDMVYRELGLEPPAPGSPVRAGAATSEDVRHALRHLHQPVELAGSPLAAGDDTAERAASVRVLLEDALARAFGASPDERLLHDIGRRAYFEPAGSHEAAAYELHVSRATYFRRLRQATERISQYLGS